MLSRYSDGVTDLTNDSVFDSHAGARSFFFFSETSKPLVASTLRPIR